MSIPKAAGIETEYAIIGDERVRASMAVVRAYRHIHLSTLSAIPEIGAEGATNNVCIPSFADCDLRLPNGSRFYVDHSHPEYSTPESPDPRVVVALDRAGAEIMRSCAQAVNRLNPLAPAIRLYKNNSDHLGNSYGCHENYLLEARTFKKLFDGKTNLLVAYLVPFLVSRIVFTGAGKVGAENGTEPVDYQLSQRADFFEEVMGLQTTYRRPIVNTRDEPHADPTRFRRLHVIAGDANMCPYACWLKVGTMQIMLRMLEDRALGESFSLADPVSAIQQISHDQTCTRQVQLEDGRNLMAIEIQLTFLEHAQRYFEQHAQTEAEKEVMQAWKETLLGLRQEPLQLLGKLDWITKRQVIDELLRRNGWSWGSPQAHMADINYHALDASESIFLLLEEKGVIVGSPGWDLAIARRFCLEPPIDSRAYLRGRCIAQFTSHIADVDWDEIVFHKQRLIMPDPLTMNQAEIEGILAQVTTPEELVQALQHTQPGLPTRQDL